MSTFYHPYAVAGARNSVAVLLVFSVAALQVQAVELPVAVRVLNIGGYCTWASLDTLARANGIDQLKGVMEHRRQQKSCLPDPGYDEEIEAELQSRGVRYEMRQQWSYETDLLERYAESYGV